MITLALSTSSSQGSLCLARASQILDQDTWKKETSHSEIVTSSLDLLLTRNGVSFENLERLVCTHGPGSFTGIRVGLSVVRSLAYSLDIPVIALSDTLAIALNHPAPVATHQLVVIDAQKNKVFAAIYLKHKNQIQEILSPCLLSPSELRPHLTEKNYLLMGDGDLFLSEFEEKIQKKLTLAPPQTRFPNAQKILEHSLDTFFHPDFLSWKELLPLYLRASAAEEVAAQKNSKKQ